MKLQKTVTIHILPNISRSKGNQTNKFGQLSNIKREIFVFEIMQKIGKRNYFQTSICFLRKLYMRQNQVVCKFEAYFDSLKLDIQ